MKSNLNVNISLPSSELVILKKIAQSLGWNLFIQEEDIVNNDFDRQQLVDRLYGCVQLPENFDYKKELEQAITDKYSL